MQEWRLINYHHHHNEGIDACRRFLDTRTDKHIPTETLCDLLRIILTMNNFTFNQHHYLQIHGTAMGTKMAPSFANLFLAIFETNALSIILFSILTLGGDISTMSS